MGHPQQGQKKILAVDDEADLTMLCRLALEYYGFQVDTFNNPQEALSNYESFCRKLSWSLTAGV
jgi:DNA-binding response OmpR family regulator